MPMFNICLNLYKLHDDYLAVIERREDLNDLEDDGVSPLSEEFTNATHHLANAFASYRSSWIGVKMIIELTTDSNTSINNNCNEDGGCSNSPWSRGCIDCIPDINFVPTCEPPTTTPYVPPTPKPLNLSLCICARILIPPLEALEISLGEVNIKIQTTMVELWECRFREDALEKAKELALILQELIEEMNVIIEQINSYTEQRSSRLAGKKISYMQKRVSSVQKMSVRDSLVVECVDRGQTAVERVKALQWIMKIFILSPTNQDVQNNLQCQTYLTTALILKMITGSVVLNDTEVSTLTNIFDDIISNQFSSLEDTINDIFEWNTSRAETLEELLEELHDEKEEIKKQIPEHMDAIQSSY